jgi:hypothetical protein
LAPEVPETKESMPTLRSLYARALLQAVRSGARSQAVGGEPVSDWSSDRVKVTGVPLSEDRLTAYRGVCAFTADDVVTAT